jgi:hypothetical protein
MGGFLVEWGSIMKIFISNKFKGENKKKLKGKLETIILILENSGHQTFNSFRDIDNWNTKVLPPGKAISWAFKRIKECNAVLCFIDSRDLSQGMLLEFGFAKALGKKIILVIPKKYPSPTLEVVADYVIRFINWKEVGRKLSRLKI